MSTSAHHRFVFAFGAAFALFYAIARARGRALFTLYPAQGIVLLETILGPVQAALLALAIRRKFMR